MAGVCLSHYSSFNTFSSTIPAAITLHKIDRNIENLPSYFNNVSSMTHDVLAVTPCGVLTVM